MVFCKDCSFLVANEYHDWIFDLEVKSMFFSISSVGFGLLGLFRWLFGGAG